MFAVFDKDGKLSGCAGHFKSEDKCWSRRLNIDCESRPELFAEYKQRLIDSGYTCAPVIVLREDVYNDTKKLCQFIGMTKEGVDIYNEFLKAGGECNETNSVNQSALAQGE